MQKTFLTLALLIVTITLKAQSSNQISVTASDTSVFTSPEFPGGNDQVYRFYMHTVRYPAKAREDNTQGKVVLQLIVEKDGSVSHFKVIQHVSDDIDAEAIRVASLMPKWTPATYQGMAVRALWTTTISFFLAK